MLSATRVKTIAQDLGFAMAGITNDLEPRHAEFYQWWLAQGYAAEMHYLHFQKNRRRSIQEILPGAKSVVMCALRFAGEKEFLADGNSTTDVGSNLTSSDTKSSADVGTTLTSPESNFSGEALAAPQSNFSREVITSPESYFAKQAPPEPRGKIARYAQGEEDYHTVLLRKLTELAQAIDREAGLAPEDKSLAYVDTGAINERALAAQAGLGWIGKNSMLIHPEEGSWFWLGEVITKIPLTPDLPEADRCGTCRRCLDACPTGAILEDVRAIDSRRCLSYLTIEHRGPIPQEFHPAMQEWLVGCDICQDVCPWNSQSLRKARREIGAPPVEWLNLNEISALERAEFKRRFAQRSISRTKFAGLQRNSSILLKNLASSKTLGSPPSPS